MIATELRHAGVGYHVAWDQAADLAIPLQFDGPQPRHFGAGPAHATAMRAGEFVGDTREGGSCNAQVFTLNAHCNGTHTECVGHVCNERVSVCEIAPAAPQVALLLSVRPRTASDHGETSDPPPCDGDALICAGDVCALMAHQPALPYTALVLRTLPNSAAKRQRVYDDAARTPYLSAEAAALLVESGIEHLLIDTPSIDRLHDAGRLTAHRIFWGLPTGASAVAAAARPGATVTEMIFAPDQIADGPYLLNLQVAPFASDAAPSRPVLYPLVAA